MRAIQRETYLMPNQPPEHGVDVGQLLPQQQLRKGVKRKASERLSKVVELEAEHSEAEAFSKPIVRSFHIHSFNTVLQTSNYKRIIDMQQLN